MVEEPQQSHQVHRAVRQVDYDCRAVDYAENGCDLVDALLVGARPATDDRRRCVEPHQVGSFEGGGPRERMDYGDPDVGQAARHPPLLSGPYR